MQEKKCEDIYDADYRCVWKNGTFSLLW